MCLVNDWCLVLSPAVGGRVLAPHIYRIAGLARGEGGGWGRGCEGRGEEGRLETPSRARSPPPSPVPVSRQLAPAAAAAAAVKEEGGERASLLDRYAALPIMLLNQLTVKGGHSTINSPVT